MNLQILKQLKNGIWLYFFLLIFEGALRKWVLPGLSESLLIVRDPVAIWLLYKSVSSGIWKPNGYVLLIFAVSILALVSALFVGHGNIWVAIYGLRITILHFPLIFVIGTVFNRADVLRMGKVVLWLCIGMTVLVAVQFYSPQSAWVNRGIGGDLEGSGFSGAAGFFRVPGTFSFTNGLAFFYGLAAAYIFHFWLVSNVSNVSKLLLISATVALLAAIPLSISRTIFFEITVTLVFMLVISGRNPKVLVKIFSASIVGFFLFLMLNNMSFFKTANLVFMERFTNANESEGGLEGVFVDRFLGGMYGAITDEKFQFWGAGLGMGTNAGAKILIGGNSKFLISEGEWGRLIGEMGLIMGMIVILIRGGVVMQLFRKAWASIGMDNTLPWMLLSFGMVIILQGPWAQPTTLGFGILIGGLIYASIEKEN